LIQVGDSQGEDHDRAAYDWWPLTINGEICGELRDDATGMTIAVDVDVDGDYATRRDMIVTHAWETWTKNGLGLDSEDRDQTTKTVQDAVNNTYVDDISDSDWLAATLDRLGSWCEQFPIGSRVEGGSGEDHDIGTIIDPTTIDRRHQMARAVFVAWDSGIRTWTPVSDITVLK
jgi:hypothetical protein